MARVRDLFLRGLGAIFVVAFASILVQIRVLVGRQGLLPACEFLRQTPWTAAPSLLRLACVGGDVPGGDARWFDLALLAGALLGIALGVALACLVATRACLIALWALNLSFVHAGQDFFSFQWDNLLLETAFFSVAVASPRGTEPHPCGVFLMRWLLVRLQVESGLAKWLGGDPQWRDGTALVAYYETAPLPTWIGWWAHQLPVGVHRATALATYVVECVLAPFALGPRRMRWIAGAAIAAMQLPILLTANYGFFNWLSLLLCLWCLDDVQLPGAWRAATRTAAAGDAVAAEPSLPPRTSRRAGAIAVAGTALLVVLSVLPFAPFLTAGGELPAPLRAATRTIAPWRSLNAYHLFVHMTRVRREAVLEGSNDGREWKPYELRWKPGDVTRAPAFVAPHQPRVDFQAWFLLLGSRVGAPWLDSLVEKLSRDPALVDSLFVRNPFPDAPPRFLRLAADRYRFTDRATRSATGAWWTRERLGATEPIRTGGRTDPGG